MSVQSSGVTLRNFLIRSDVRPPAARMANPKNRNSTTSYTAGLIRGVHVPPSVTNLFGRLPLKVSIVMLGGRVSTLEGIIPDNRLEASDVTIRNQEHR